MSQEFFRFDCPACQRQLKVPEQGIYKKIFCPRCNCILEASQPDTGSLLEFSVASKQANICGPPVHRDFIRAEISADVSQQSPHEPVGRDCAGESATQQTEKFSKAKNWAKKHSKVQTVFDEYLIRIGIGGLLVGISMLLVPWVRTVLLKVPPLPFNLPLLGLLICGFAIVSLGIVSRRKPKRIISLLLGLGLPVVALVLFMPPPIMPEASPVAVAYLPQSLPDEPKRKEGKFVGLTEKAPTASFVPESEKPDSGSSKSQTPEASNTRRLPNQVFPISPIKGDVKEFDSENTPIIKRIEVKPTRLLGKSRITRRTPEQLKNDFINAWKRWELNPALSDEAKLSRLKVREKEFQHTRTSKRVLRDEKAKLDYGVTDAAGKSTVFGNAVFRRLPIHGIDVGSVGNRLEKFLPLSTGPEFDDSLAWDANFFLVGLNVNANSFVEGVQGVFAPVVDGELNMDEQVTGPWYGEPAAKSSDLKTTTSFGNPVYGVVVYKNKLDIVGLSLVIGL